MLESPVIRGKVKHLIKRVKGGNGSDKIGGKGQRFLSFNFGIASSDGE